MISIIVPNFNHLPFLPKRLNTILNQSFQDFELILLDDCSTDGSWEYLKQFEFHPKVSHCIRNERNSGSPFRQWEKGIGLAQYDWIWIAESDDFSDKHFLSELITRIDDSSNLVFSKSVFVDQFDLQIIDESFIKEMKDFEITNDFESMDGIAFIKQFLSLRNFVLNASSVLFRKPSEFPKQILNMKFTGDWYFWIYLLKDGNVKYVSKPLNFFRFHLNTTRVWRGKQMEFIKCQEYMDCFDFAFSYIKLNNLFKYDLGYYNDFIEKYLKYNRKLGTLRFSVFFPKIPLVFYLKYYQLFIIGLIKR